MIKNLPAIARDTRDKGSVPGSGRHPGAGNDNPPQYSCLENSMDRRALYSPWGRKESDMIEHIHTTQLNVLFKDSSLCGKITAVDQWGSNFLSYNLENSNITSKE